jgi:hypothetical protein
MEYECKFPRFGPRESNLIAVRTIWKIFLGDNHNDAEKLIDLVKVGKKAWKILKEMEKKINNPDCDINFVKIKGQGLRNQADLYGKQKYSDRKKLLEFQR